MQEPEVKLKRVLGFWPAYGTAVGLVVSGTAMVSVGNVAGLCGKAAFITGLIGLISMMAAAFAYDELTAILPDFPRLWKAPFGIPSMIIGILGVIYAIWTLKFVWIPSAIYMTAIAIYTIWWLKRKNLSISEVIPIEKVAKDIMERSEELPKWDNAVKEWLKNREAKEAI